MQLRKYLFDYAMDTRKSIGILFTPFLLAILLLTVGLIYKVNFMLLLSLVLLFFVLIVQAILLTIRNKVNRMKFEEAERRREYENKIIEEKIRKMQEERKKKMEEEFKKFQERKEKRTKNYLKKYYQILGLNENANAEEVKKAFRKLAKINHPDAGGDTKMFIKIKEAYDKIIKQVG
jgi:ABC-type multidrug transport system fused ATPase/permease subunit